MAVLIVLIPLAERLPASRSCSCSCSASSNLVAVINNITFRQEETPEDMQSRVNTTGRMLSWGLGAPRARCSAASSRSRYGPAAGMAVGARARRGVRSAWLSAWAVPALRPVAAAAPETSRADAHPARPAYLLPVSCDPAQPEEIPVLLRMSSLFLRTLREDPADAEVPSHRLLVRAGYVRRVAPGIFSWLPLGYHVYRNVERIVREEMDAAGFQEVHFPALLPREPYEATGPLDRVRRRPLPAQGPHATTTTCSAPRTRRCSRSGQGRVLVVQGPARSRSTRSRPSTATRRVPARASCAAASS